MSMPPPVTRQTNARRSFTLDDEDYEIAAVLDQPHVRTDGLIAPGVVSRIFSTFETEDGAPDFTKRAKFRNSCEMDISLDKILSRK